MKKIIVPTDFSDQAGYALDLAVEIAKKMDAEITLVHVIEYYKKGSVFLGSSAIETEASLSTGIEIDDIYFIQLFNKRKEDFRALLRNPKLEGVKINDKILMGTPYHAIEEEITLINADLIIMGTTGISDWEESLIGSTAEKVVRHAECPVLTLRNPVSVQDIHKIAFAHDYFEKETSLIQVPKKMQEFFQSDLHLVYINTPAHFKNERDGMEAIRRFAEENGIQNYKAHFYSHFHEDEGIVWFTEDYKIDMVMMSTSGRTGLMRYFERSISEDVVNISKKPVLTYNLKSLKKIKEKVEDL